MKLYTEEQVKDVLGDLLDNDFAFQYYLKKLTPIELPSDEEIKKEFTIIDTTYPHMIAGAKWMKEQILERDDKTFKQKSKWTEVDNMTRPLK